MIPKTIFAFLFIAAFPFCIINAEDNSPKNTGKEQGTKLEIPALPDIPADAIDDARQILNKILTEEENKQKEGDSAKNGNNKKNSSNDNSNGKSQVNKPDKPDKPDKPNKPDKENPGKGKN